MRSERDELWMRGAVALSRRGFPAPNPHVGCVLVKDGRIVGEGWHAYAGGDHAEAAALKRAGAAARGATAYVTLEPCAHQGRTPPCSRALKEAGVARVVIGCLDPNPQAAGGAEALRRAGVEVETGVLEEEARKANWAYLHAMRLGRPAVVAKAALSLDGRIALPSGESQWITGEAARRAGHRLRAECGAVLVGRRTVERDDPALTARIPGVKNQPVKVVLDPSGRLRGDEKVFQGPGECLHATLESFGACAAGGRFDLPKLLRALFERGITGLLVEGGAHTLAGFIAAGCVDRYELFLAPKLLGDGPAWIEGLGLKGLAEAPRLRIARVRRLGEDLQVTALPAEP